MKALYEAQVRAGSTPIHAPEQPNWPSCFFNGMIHPLAPFAMRGVLWYQGEGDAGNHAPYAAKMVSLIKTWRALWQRPDLPFITTQLMGFAGSGDEPPDSDKHKWAELRAAQAQVPSMVTNTYMATLIDAGMHYNIHPFQKETAGQRLALVARKEVYSDSVAAYGPRFQAVARKEGALALSFRNAGQGLVAREVDLDGTRLPGGVLRGFTLAGPDREFVKAEARIEGSQVIVSSPQIPAPIVVRYAWADFPLANLYNAEGLPASPFQAEIAAQHQMNLQKN